MRHGGGSIASIASVSGLRASTLRAAYGAGKAALIHLMRQQAAELGAQGIRVNAVAPGPVETAMAAQVHTPVIRAGYHAAIPLGSTPPASASMTCLRAPGDEAFGRSADFPRGLVRSVHRLTLNLKLVDSPASRYF